MLLERAELLIREGLEAEFAAAMTERGLRALGGVPGVVSVRMGRGVENPVKFMLLVEWQSMDAHKAFTRSADYAVFVDIIKPFSNGGSMEHFSFD